MTALVDVKGYLRMNNQVQCSNASEGATIYKLLDALLSGNIKYIELDFNGITNVTTAFVENALLPLLEKHSFEEIKKRVNLINTNSQINKMVRRMFKEAVKKTTNR